MQVPGNTIVYLFPQEYEISPKVKRMKTVGRLLESSAIAYLCLLQSWQSLGLRHQFLPPAIQPLRDDMAVIGRAMPVLEADVFSESLAGSANALMEKPFGLMFA